MNLFELARGYSPSIFESQREKIPHNIFNAHLDRESIKAVERMVERKIQNNISNDLVPPGTKIVVYYRSSKNNEANEWI